jgi:hypothetical protein
VLALSYPGQTRDRVLEGADLEHVLDHRLDLDQG